MPVPTEGSGPAVGRRVPSRPGGVGRRAWIPRFISYPTVPQGASLGPCPRNLIVRRLSPRRLVSGLVRPLTSSYPPRAKSYRFAVFTGARVPIFSNRSPHASSRMTKQAQASLERILLLAIALVLTTRLGFAQFGEVGHSITTTPAQQQALDQAKTFLESTGENLTGITLTNADLRGNIPAAMSANGTVLGIDFARLEAVVPPGTPGAPGYPGCVLILVFHELQHAHHGWGKDFCSEVGNTIYTATKHCEFICWIQTNGGGPLDALCLMYAHVRSLANGADMQAQIDQHGCVCTPSCTIPPCGCCE